MYNKRTIRNKLILCSFLLGLIVFSGCKEKDRNKEDVITTFGILLDNFNYRQGIGIILDERNNTNGTNSTILDIFTNNTYGTKANSTAGSDNTLLNSRLKSLFRNRRDRNPVITSFRITPRNPGAGQNISIYLSARDDNGIIGLKLLFADKPILFDNEHDFLDCNNKRLCSKQFTMNIPKSLQGKIIFTAIAEDTVSNKAVTNLSISLLNYSFSVPTLEMESTTTTALNSVQESPKQAFPDNGNVLIVYNTAYTEDSNLNEIQDSYEIAMYYQAKRRIPSINVCPVNTAVSETINRQQYDRNFDTTDNYDDITHIKQVIEDCLISRGIRDKIRYIVLVKGIPLRIDPYQYADYNYADYSSVDAAVALLFQNYSITWRLTNPYFNKATNLTLQNLFEGFTYQGAGFNLSYLVTRIDGYNASEVINSIDKAWSHDISLMAQWVLDDDPDGAGWDCDYMSNANTLLCNNLQLCSYVSYENTNLALTSPEDVNYNEVVGYSSHGVYGSELGDNAIQNGILSFGLKNGSVYTSWESFNGITFSTPDITTHNTIADWIRYGGTAGVGNVYEPWCSGIVHEDILFSRLAAGYPLADASYMSMQYLDFVTVVAGDPLLTLIPDTSIPRIVIDYPPNNSRIIPGTYLNLSIYDNQLDTILYTYNKDVTPFNMPFDIDTKDWDYGIPNISVFAEDHEGNSFSLNLLYEINYTKGEIPIAKSFDGDTTEFHRLYDRTNVSSAVLEKSQFGKIEFNENINTSGINFDNVVSIVYNYAEIDADKEPRLNKSANISLYNLPFEYPVVWKDSTICPSNICKINNYINGVLNFRVIHFSSFTITANTNLTIWDDSELQPNNEPRNHDELYRFYAKYTDISTGAVISNADCNISFPDKSDLMLFNSSGFFEYSRGFSEAGLFSYNVSCLSEGYESLDASETANIGKCAVPSTGNWNINTKQICSNAQHIFKGNITISEHGNLSLLGATFIFNTSYDNQYGILILPGGSMFIQNGSLIKPLNKEYSMTFYGTSGSVFLMKDSQVEYVGNSAVVGTRGLEINTPPIEFRNNRIIGNYYGIIIDGGDNYILVNNEIVNSSMAAIYFYYSTDSYAINNTLINNPRGLYDSQTKNMIYDSNLIMGGIYGLASSYSTNISARYNIIKSASYGVYFYQTENSILSNNSINNSQTIGMYISKLGINNKKYYNHTIDISNTINGLPIYYIFDKDYYVLEHVASGHIEVINSNDVSIINSQVISGDGIEVINSNDVSIINSSVINGFRIEVRDSNDVSIINSSVINGDGIYLIHSISTKVLDNNLTSNLYGIYLSFNNSNIVIQGNTILNTLSQAVYQYFNRNISINNNLFLYNNYIGSHSYSNATYSYNTICYNGDLFSDVQQELLNNTYCVIPQNISNNSQSSELTPKFYFNVSNAITSNINCSLYINNTLHGNVSRIREKTKYAITSDTSYQPGNIEWYISCNDGKGNSGLSQKYLLILNLKPNITSIECLINDSLDWMLCNNTNYNSNLSGIRVNCTDNEQVVNSSITIKNVNDNHIFINKSLSYKGEDVWETSTKFQIRDSGTWLIQASCTDNLNSSASESISWTIPWGRIESYLIQPVSDVIVNKNEEFTVATGVKCTDGECGDINATLDPTVTITEDKEDYTIYADGGYGAFYDWGENYIGYTSLYRTVYRFNISALLGWLQSAELYIYTYGVDMSLAKAYLGNADISFEKCNADALSCWLNTSQESGSHIFDITRWDGTYMGYDIKEVLQRYINENKEILFLYILEDTATVFSGAAGDYSGSLQPYINFEILPFDVYITPSPVGLFTNASCTANLSFAPISINYVISAPDGVKISFNQSSSILENLYSSPSFYVDKRGTWTCNFTVVDEESVKYNLSISFYAGDKITIVSTKPGELPFYTTSENPYICRNLYAGDSCNTTWRVIPTGKKDSAWDLFTIYTSANYSTNINKTLSQTILAEINCTERWECSVWGDCINSMQSRACTDTNECGTIFMIPYLGQVCTSQGGGNGGGGSGGSGGGGTDTQGNDSLNNDENDTNYVWTNISSVTPLLTVDENETSKIITNISCMPSEKCNVTFVIPLCNHNSICDDGEDTRTCPADCSKTLIIKRVVLVVSIIFALVLLILAAKFGIKLASKKIRSIHYKKRLEKYINKCLASGVSQERIINLLARVGWNKDKIQKITSSIIRKRNRRLNR